MGQMDRRLALHEILCRILGSRNVYFQPPASVKLKYPCIMYSRDDIQNTSADDITYKQSHFYQIIVMDYDPDSEIVHKVSRLPMCIYDRHYASDNLNHDVFTICY